MGEMVLHIATAIRHESCSILKRETKEACVHWRRRNRRNMAIEPHEKTPKHQVTADGTFGIRFDTQHLFQCLLSGNTGSLESVSTEQRPLTKDIDMPRLIEDLCTQVAFQFEEFLVNRINMMGGHPQGDSRA